MAIIGYSCDRCRQPIEINRTLLHVQAGPMRQHHPAVDLCPDCAGELVAWLKADPDDIASIEPKPIVKANRSA